MDDDGPCDGNCGAEGCDPRVPIRLGDKAFVKCVDCGHLFETDNPDAGRFGLICPGCVKAEARA